MREFKCGCCGGEPDCPMINDVLWSKHFGKNVLVCWDCFEQTIERPIEWVDMLPCPMTRQMRKVAEKVRAGFL